MAHFIAEALGCCQPSQHATAHNGVLLSQAAAAVNGTHAPHLQVHTCIVINNAQARCATGLLAAVLIDTAEVGESVDNATKAFAILIHSSAVQSCMDEVNMQTTCGKWWAKCSRKTIRTLRRNREDHHANLRQKQSGMYCKIKIWSLALQFLKKSRRQMPEPMLNYEMDNARLFPDVSSLK